MQEDGTAAEIQQSSSSDGGLELAYMQLGFGFLLVVLMFGIIIYYFSAKRKNTIESPKYDMMKDDEDE